MGASLLRPPRCATHMTLLQPLSFRASMPQLGQPRVVCSSARPSCSRRREGQEACTAPPPRRTPPSRPLPTWRRARAAAWRLSRAAFAAASAAAAACGSPHPARAAADAAAALAAAAAAPPSPSDVAIASFQRNSSPTSFSASAVRSCAGSGGREGPPPPNMSKSSSK